MHLLVSKASSSSRVAGPPVHALLHVSLVGVAFVGELLLRARKLRRVHSWIIPRHPRAHRVPPGVHGVVVTSHGVPQHLWMADKQLTQT